MKRAYHVRIVRVRRNTGAVGGPWVCEAGHWEPDLLRGKRDVFRVERTIRTGTRAECEAARRNP